jgi:hypothetical protein
MAWGLTVRYHLPVGPKFVPVKLGPGLNETHLPPRQLTLHQLQRVDGECRKTSRILSSVISLLLQ